MCPQKSTSASARYSLPPARGQIACAAIRDRRDPRSPRHGLESPCHVARAFQPVGLGRAVRSALCPRPLLRPPPSPFPPVKNPSVCSVCSVGQPSSSAVCRPPSGTGLISFPSSFVSYLAPVTHSGCAFGPQRCLRLRAACLRRACLTEAQKRPPWFRLVRGHEGSAE